MQDLVRHPVTRVLVGIVAVLAVTGLLDHAANYDCAACGKPIDADFVKAGGARYHPEHFVCALCEKVLDGEYVVHEGHNYHASCYRDRVAPRCALCSKALEGRYLEDYWGNAYHTRHEKEAQRCEYCTRFISEKLTKGGVEYNDGRIVCKLCQRRAIDGEEEAVALMRSVATSLREFGIVVDVRTVKLHLVDLKSLRKLAGSSRHALQGFTQFQQDTVGGVPISSAVDVSMLWGLPKEEAASTLAHELMHVWLFSKNREQRNAALTEGSCNYAAYLVLGQEPGPLSGLIIEAMMESNDPAYGKGFRRVKRFADEKGTKAWLALLASRDKLPAGY